MIRFLVVVAVLWFALCAFPVMAEQVVDIYRAEVLVKSQSAAVRNIAAREAMREVLIRVSGDTTAPEQPAISAAINQAQNYLLEFSYASTDKRLEVDGESIPATILVAKFSPQGIERLLREARLPLWPASRPKLLIWSVQQDPAGAFHRVPDDTITAALSQRAALRGLPLALPLHDFEDTIALSSDNLWNFDEAAIKEASERYRPDAILVGRYSQTADEQWQASWQLIHASGNKTFDDQADTAPTLFTRALDAVADSFARLYAVVPSESGPDVIVMQVENVVDFGAHKNLQRYLEGLVMVKRLELLKTEGQQQLLRLYIEGDQAQLLSTLVLGKKLYPLEIESVGITPALPAFDPVDLLDSGLPPPLPAFAPGSLGKPLVYRWQP